MLFYCHDSYGLGHLRRTLTLAQHLRTCMPSMSPLIVTGSPVAQNFPFPEGADYIKLPSVVKVGAEQYASRSIPVPFKEIRDMRGDILLSAASHFRPDVLVVDHTPAGLKGEIVPALRYLKQNSPHTRLILGLRDIVDEAPRVREAWTREDVYPLLDDIYDVILVYGQPEVFDVVREYGLSPRAAAKTHYVGYLRREMSGRSREQVRADLSMRTDKLVVVTAGGGGDGYELFRAVLEALRLRPESAGFDCLLVGGPLMPAPDRESLAELVSPGTAVHFLDFAEDMASYLAAADVVISMGGYNSVCEILSFERQAIIVPRVTPRKEQLLRAEALHRRGLVHMIHPAELTPARLLQEVDDLLEHPSAPGATLNMNGLQNVAGEIEAILAQETACAAAISHW